MDRTFLDEWADRAIRLYKKHIQRLLVWERWGQLSLSWFFRYTVLISIVFTLLYPVFFALCVAFKTKVDAVDSTVQWVPRHLSLDNFQTVFKLMDFWNNLKTTVYLSVVPAALQCLSCAIAGYGFARPAGKFTSGMMVLLLVTLIVPDQAVIVPLYRQYSSYGWLGTFLPFVAPAVIGHGLRGALFVLMFRQYFKGQPWELEESASIDGAGPFRVFWQVMYPLSKPLILVVFLFSLVWHWNDTFSVNMFIANAGLGAVPGLALRILSIPSLLSNGVFGQTAEINMGGAVDSAVTLPYLMAATIVALSPLLLIYVFAQRYFVEGVERSGLTGE